MNEGERHMNSLEMLNSMTDLARSTRRFYEALVAEGFAEADALKLTQTFISGITGARSAGEDSPQ